MTPYQVLLARVPSAKLDSVTGEPYLPILFPPDKPQQGAFRLMPWREGDENVLPAVMNDERIYLNLANVPYPYTEEHAKQWTTARLSQDAPLLRLLSDPAASAADLARIAGCPFSVVREVRYRDGDGSADERGGEGEENAETTEGSAILGHMGIQPDDPAHAPGGFLGPYPTHGQLSDGVPSASSIVWSVGDWLHPSHHNRGIMTAVLHTLLRAYIIPIMGVRRVRATALVGNWPSRRVFEKTGFRYVGVQEKAIKFVESKGGGERDIWIFEWDGEEA